MSDDKLRILQEEFSDSFIKNSALKESQPAAATRNVNETALLSMELNEKDIDKSLILLDKPESFRAADNGTCYDNVEVVKRAKKPMITPRLFENKDQRGAHR